jgi:hypothetical protein
MGHPLKHTETDDLDEAWKKENKHENNKKMLFYPCFLMTARS